MIVSALDWVKKKCQTLKLILEHGKHNGCELWFSDTKVISRLRTFLQNLAPGQPLNESQMTQCQ